MASERVHYDGDVFFDVLTPCGRSPRFILHTDDWRKVTCRKCRKAGLRLWNELDAAIQLWTEDGGITNGKR